MQKLNNNSITVQEFSTGLVFNSTEKDGGIVALSQNWMNVSFPDGKIPNSIERAIANQYFSANGTETQPSIIGRFIPSIEGNWSVVAISNLLKTIDGELLPVSRFLVTPGNTLEHLVNWVQSHYLLFDSYPIFDPSETLCERNNQLFLFSQQDLFLSKKLKQELREKAKGNLPLIVSKNLPLTAVYHQASHIAKVTISPVAFAFQAVNLRKCGSFQLVHTHCEQEIKDVLAKEHPAITPNLVIFDEERIKGLIKRLINQEAVSLNALSDFMKEVTESALPTQYWHKIFDEEGAKMALTKEIAPPIMIKLLTLRCLAIRGTEQEFMNWISKNSSPLITEVYNDFRGKLLRNLTSYYGCCFELFSLDDEDKPIYENFYPYS